MARLLALAVLAAVTMTQAAQARPASKGPYAEVGFGGASFIGDESDDAALGLSGSVRVGTDLFSWLSIGARVGLSSHEATVPPPPEGEYFQLYTAAVEGRLAVRFEWLEVFVDGSFGGAMLSTNVLEKVGVIEPGERFSSVFTAGGGLEYQLQNRHYALGVAGDWTLLPGFARAQLIGGRAYLRYTY